MKELKKVSTKILQEELEKRLKKDAESDRQSALVEAETARKKVLNKFLKGKFYRASIETSRLIYATSEAEARWLFIDRLYDEDEFPLNKKNVVVQESSKQLPGENVSAYLEWDLVEDVNQFNCNYSHIELDAYYTKNVKDIIKIKKILETPLTIKDIEKF